MTNPAESHRLKTPAYQQRLALGIERGVAAFVAP
jgi:N-acetylmuramoyl-L-alanine amidase